MSKRVTGLPTRQKARTTRKQGGRVKPAIGSAARSRIQSCRSVPIELGQNESPGDFNPCRCARNGGTPHFGAGFIQPPRTTPQCPSIRAIHSQDPRNLLDRPSQPINELASGTDFRAPRGWWNQWSAPAGRTATRMIGVSALGDNRPARNLLQSVPTTTKGCCEFAAAF